MPGSGTGWGMEALPTAAGHVAWEHPPGERDGNVAYCRLGPEDYDRLGLSERHEMDRRLLARTKGMFTPSSRRPPGRDVAIRPDDVFLVSYPRSGNTWMRFLVGNILSDDPIDFTSVHATIPDIYMETRRSLSRKSGPRILKSHEPYDSRYPRVVYIVRDPRDVVVSYYWYQHGHGALDGAETMDEFVLRVVEGKVAYGSWGAHVGGWLDADSVLVVRYEDLHADPAGYLGRVAEFAGLPTDEALIARAVDRSTFTSMRGSDVQRRPGTPSPHRHVRVGEAQNWEGELAAETVALIHGRWGSSMERLAYLP